MADYPIMKPCPFCGKAPVLHRTMEAYPADDKHEAGEYELGVSIVCNECGFSINNEDGDEALKVWNTRSIPRTQLMAYAVAAIKETVDEIEDFDNESTKANYTEIEKVWDLMYQWRDRLKEHTVLDESAGH